MRMWEIRENVGRYDREGYRYGMRDKTSKEAYECGYEDGYKAALEEVEEEIERDEKVKPHHRIAERRYR